jgi:hypothetical protein
MTTHHSRTKVPVGTATSTTIGFRLDDETRRVLFERAARLQVSPHELARRYVIEVLQESEERIALREAVETLNADLDQFRSGFALAMEALLVSAGKVSVTDARDWVDKTLHPH